MFCGVFVEDRKLYSNLHTIENAFKDPEEKNSSEGIVGKYEVY